MLSTLIPPLESQGFLQVGPHMDMLDVKEGIVGKPLTEYLRRNR